MPMEFQLLALSLIVTEGGIRQLDVVFFSSAFLNFFGSDC